MAKVYYRQTQDPEQSKKQYLHSVEWIKKTRKWSLICNIMLFMIIAALSIYIRKML